MQFLFSLRFALVWHFIRVRPSLLSLFFFSTQKMGSTFDFNPLQKVFFKTSVRKEKRWGAEKRDSYFQSFNCISFSFKEGHPFQ